jgi:hypothetical protein
LLDVNTESAIKKCNETLLGAGESMSKTVWFDASEKRNTSRWSDLAAGEENDLGRFAPVQNSQKISGQSS